MQLREFGSTGVAVSPIAFGAMRITADAGGASSVMLHALERGVLGDRHGAQLRRERSDCRADAGASGAAHDRSSPRR